MNAREWRFRNSADVLASPGEAFDVIRSVDALTQQIVDLKHALQSLLRAADNSNCDSVACNAARDAISKATGTAS